MEKRYHGHLAELKKENPLNTPKVINPRKVKLNWSVNFPSQKKTMALINVAAE